ncbi:uncharacterized protein LOC119110704 isoform X2 [Pollicipes pollicipes]|uniref:uncharacterized protein LOC119110704 isoform X1 n=1 Tax=Pollicipes pollicipes TaxID=41117 RepID=UPI00188559AE|nr:uncharacterized protein LOC119110704 isoform X1 [Pollicipes pollicipes]XP_037090502.1 uncharacterized protein LOC119110704 isoform X2 [Pollicipes pollicipes]
MGSSHRGTLQLAFTVLSVVVFAVVLFFNFAAGSTSLGIFNQSTGNVSDKYQVFLTPPGWTFIIWGVIYSWMAVALIYALSQLCRRTAAGPVYLNPATLTSPFWFFFIVNQALNVGWLFIWDRELLTASAVVLCIVMITNWLVMLILHRSLYLCRVSPEPPTPREVWLLRLCVHNGLAVYTTWTTVAALISIDVALVYVGEASDELVTSLLAGLLAAGALAWLLLELTVLDKYTRWTISPGFALLWALTGVFQNNYWRAPGSTPAMVATALGVACVTLAVRLAVLGVRVLRERGRGQMTVSLHKMSSR